MCVLRCDGSPAHADDKLNGERQATAVPERADSEKRTALRVGQSATAERDRTTSCHGRIAQLMVPNRTNTKRTLTRNSIFV